MLRLKRSGHRLLAQGLVEYGLTMAVVALVVMIGANQLSGALGAYFAATGPSLAPPAPTFTPIGSATRVTVASVSGSYGGTVTLSATLTVVSSSVGVNGETMYFTINGTPVCGGSTGVTCPTTNSSGTATLSINLGTTAPGAYSSGVGAQFVGDSTYIASSSTGSLTVTQASQTITFTQPATPAAYGSNFTIAPTASSGLPVTVAGSGGCTVSGSGPTYSVTMTSGSTACQLTASQAGNTNYSAASNVTVVVAASQATATVSITNTSQTYNGSTRPVIVTTNPTGLATSVTYLGVGYGPTSTAPTAVGTYAVSATISDPNYTGTATATLVVSQGTATVNIGNTSQTYNGSALAVTVSTTPSGLSTSVIYSGTGYGPTSTAPTNSGNYSVSANVNNPNYVGSGSATLVISPRATNVNANSATGNFGTSVNLQATLTDAGGTPISGATLSFSLNGTTVGTAVTNASGVATLNNASLGTIAKGNYTNGVGASFAGDANDVASSGTAKLTVK